MKKLFLAICFIALGLINAEAKVMEVLDQTEVPKAQAPLKNQSSTVKKLNTEEMANFLAERAKDVVKIDEKDFDESKQKSIYVEPSEEAKAALKEEQKGAFQKMYEQALERANQSPAAVTRPDMVANRPQDRRQQQQNWENPDFPVINVLLPPNNKKVLVPAQEHIPYLFSKIEVLSNGMVKFDETIMVVSNAQKLKKGLTKILPKYLYSRNGAKQKIDYSLLSVTINDQPVEYKITEQGEQVLLVPALNYELGSGVYTYNLQYVNNMAIWNYGDFHEFYWNITGSAWNLVVARAGATVTLPPQVQPLGQEILVGYPQNLKTDLAVVLQENASTWGYIVPTPLFIGEGFHLVISLPENAILAPSLLNRILQKIDNNGEIIFAALGFLTILLSFIVSWRYIKKDRGQIKFTLKKNAIMLRYLATNKYDSTSFVAFLLELYRKNIIDIQQSKETILIIKRTDNLQSLSKYERKSLNQLFTGNDAVLNLNPSNALKIKRAYLLLGKDLNQRLGRFLRKLNIGYQAFSWAMLLVSELFIASLFANILNMWLIMASCTAIGGLAIYCFNWQWERKWLNWISKSAAISIMALTFVFLSAFISPWAVLYIALSLLTIKIYTSTYSQRNGLLRAQIVEAQELKKRLLLRRDDILLGKEIVNQQSNIAALELIDEFLIDENKSEFYKLDTAREILKKLS